MSGERCEYSQSHDHECGDSERDEWMSVEWYVVQVVVHQKF